MAYKDKLATFFMKGIQTEKVIPTLTMGVNSDIMDQNLGDPITNVQGAQ